MKGEQNAIRYKHAKRQKDISPDGIFHEEDQYQSKTNERRYQTMNMGLYAIKDELSGFTGPIMIEDDKQAKRFFKNQLENNQMMRNNPTDFSIWLVGQYNTDKGIIRALPENELTKIDWGVKDE